jgi:hypothetical protein
MEQTLQQYVSLPDSGKREGHVVIRLSDELLLPPLDSANDAVWIRAPRDERLWCCGIFM